MAIALSATLSAHQKNTARRPALAVTAAATRFGIEHPRWTRYYTGAEADAPTAVVVANDGSLVRARNNAGALDWSRVASPGSGSTYSSWTNIVAITSGSAIALAAKTTELLLAYVDNVSLTLKVRTSADNGVSWSAATTVVTEAAAIAGMAVAYRPNGDACLFYCVGTNVKSLRRVAGVWAAAGTAWSRSGSVATLTGVATAHDGGDFVVIVTGTAVTTTHKRVWGCWMGDGAVLVSNAWSTLTSVAEADSLSTVTFIGPAVMMLGLQPAASYAHKEAGSVAYNREYTTHTDITGFPTATWSEPAPHEAASAFGMSLAKSTTGLWAVVPSGVWYASRPASVTLTSKILSAQFEQTASSTKARITLDNTGGVFNAAPNATYPSLYPGGSLTLQPGYGSGTAAAAEFGVSYTLTVERISYGREDGRSQCIVEASGPWEQLAHWRPPQAWQTAGALLTRAAIFQRIANRAGIFVNGTGSANWTTDKPAFAIPAGETGSEAAARLFTVESSIVIPGSDFKYKNPAAGDAADWNYGGSGQHPIVALQLVTAPAAANWVRLQGPDRYSDRQTLAEIYAVGPRLALVRSLDAGTNAKADAYAANAIRRRVVLEQCGELRCPLDAGAELLDVIAITDTQLGLSASKKRIIGLRWRYERGGGKTPARYESTYTLGGL